MGKHDLLDTSPLDRPLIEKAHQATERQWRQKARAGIEAYNRHVEKYGVFSDVSRRF